MKYPTHTRLTKLSSKRAGRQGYVLVMALVFMAIFVMVFAGFINHMTLYARSQHIAIADKQAIALAEAGIDKAIYELNQNAGYTGEVNTALGAGTFTTTVTAVNSNTKHVTVVGYVPNSTSPRAMRTIKADVTINADVIAFQFGVQSDNGGVDLQNSASVRGNLFSNGPITGANSNIVRGDVISAGPSGLIDGIYATNTARAHTITDSDIDKDAYYQSISGTSIGGTSYLGSADVATSSLPIPDTQVEEWKTAAAAGGVHTTPCPYTISSSVTIGPKKINCDVTISGGTVTLAGPLWVSGNLTIKNSPTITIDPSLGSQSVAIVVDNESNRTTSSKLSMDNSMTVEGTGQTGSYVMFLSQNNSAQNGGNETAIEVSNSASGDMLIYAGHGRIALENNINLKEVTGYRIEVKNSAEIVYETGLGSALFSSGPGGSWAYIPGTYSIK
ncbi:hypothetical protein HZC00_01570 [Candidatus Kaiserbacteria bacterium]|nr:hypothetical protein [Candidatus Kaiserbacteria bacterium]